MKNNIESTYWDINKEKLLQELAIDISREFWIEQKTAKKLIQTTTSESLDSLKAEIEQSEWKEIPSLDTQKLHKLAFTISWAKELIEKISQAEISVLKKELFWEENISEYTKTSEKYFPKSLIDTAKNPKLPHQHILGFTLGILDSFLPTVEALYQIGIWTIKAPYHIYMIVTGKWKTHSFKNL